MEGRDEGGTTPTPTPTPTNVGHGPEEERTKVAEEERGKPTKTVKAEAGEDGGAGAGLINIKVQSQTAGDVFFRVKRNAKLRRIMDMYCGKLSLHPKAVRFLSPYGGYVRGDQTPDEVGLQDGDEILIVLTQMGGAARASQSST